MKTLQLVKGGSNGGKGEGRLSRLRARVIAAGAVLGLASSAMAAPPTMPPIEFPVDLASIAEEIATAGGTILLLVMGVVIGFVLVRKLFSRVRGAI